MEDAMVINKGSYERGFAHASVYKSEFIDLANIARERSQVPLLFGCSPKDEKVTSGKLDIDGFPLIGTYLEEGSPYYRYYLSVVIAVIEWLLIYYTSYYYRSAKAGEYSFGCVRLSVHSTHPLLQMGLCGFVLIQKGFMSHKYVSTVVFVGGGGEQGRKIKYKHDLIFSIIMATLKCFMDRFM